MGPRKVNAPASAMACAGVIAWVATAAATMLAVSWKPLV
jgi:hypothetical protein